MPVSTPNTAVIQHLETYFVAALIGIGFIVAVIYWLWRRFRTRRPKKDPAK